jgi:hypothetical protein
VPRCEHCDQPKAAHGSDGGCPVPQDWPDTPVPEPPTADQMSKLKDMAFDRAWRAEDLAWRPNLYQGMFGHLPVAEGEVWPQNISATALRSLPWLAPLFKAAVPDEYIAVDLNEEGYSEAQITCPCGAVHCVEVGTILRAPCDRAFYWFGKDVRVARLSDHPDEPSPPATSD